MPVVIVTRVRVVIVFLAFGVLEVRNVSCNEVTAGPHVVDRETALHTGPFESGRQLVKALWRHDSISPSAGIRFRA